MSRPIAVLRPEPGNRVTASAIEGGGRIAIRLPLFVTRPIAWPIPDPAAHDALILTSANALRHGGPGLANLLDLPVHAVGRATAAAARRAGFDVVAIGEAGSDALLALSETMGVRRALHLGGRERRVEAGGPVARAIAVYASEPLDIPDPALASLRGSVALVHSPRAGARLGELVDKTGPGRPTIRIAAISARAAEAAGPGWDAVAVARSPDDEALLDAANRLAD